LGRLVSPALLVEPSRRIAPRSIIGFGDIAPKPGHDRFEVSNEQGLDELSHRIGFADLVRIQRPEFDPSSGGRAPLRGRRGYGLKGFRKGGLGGNLRGRKVRTDV